MLLNGGFKGIKVSHIEQKLADGAQIFISESISMASGVGSTILRRFTVVFQNKLRDLRYLFSRRGILGILLHGSLHTRCPFDHIAPVRFETDEYEASTVAPREK